MKHPHTIPSNENYYLPSVCLFENNEATELKYATSGRRWINVIVTRGVIHNYKRMESKHRQALQQCKLKHPHILGEPRRIPGFPRQEAPLVARAPPTKRNLIHSPYICLQCMSRDASACAEVERVGSKKRLAWQLDSWPGWLWSKAL